MRAIKLIIKVIIVISLKFLFFSSLPYYIYRVGTEYMLFTDKS